MKMIEDRKTALKKMNELKPNYKLDYL